MTSDFKQKKSPKSRRISGFGVLRTWQFHGIYRGVIIFIIILLQNLIASAQLLDVPLGDELYREVYDFVDRMVAHGYVTKVFKNTQPYSHGEVAQILIELERKVKDGSLNLSRVERERLRQLLLAFSEDLQSMGYSITSNAKRVHLFQTLGEKHRFSIDFGMGENIISRRREAKENKTGYATLFRPTATGQIRDDFAFYSDLKVYYLGAVQFPDFPKTEVRQSQPPATSATAALTTYYMKFNLPWFEVLLGKDNLHWGAGRRGALLMSENPLPMNMFKLTAQYHPVKFQSFTSALDSNQHGKKYISGHRLEIHLWEKLRLGMAETIVYGENFETVFLNPVQIYIVSELAKGSPYNVLVSGDLDVRLLRNLELYGELLIDDFRPFSFGLRSYKNWGSKFGVLFGCYYVDPFFLYDTDVRIEYAFINQYTYTHWKPITTYTHFNSIIGHQIGTDADDLWLNFRHWFSEHFALSLGYELERHGEGDVNKPHPKDAPDDDEWEFLSGVTESTSSISLGVSYRSIGGYFLNAEYTRSWIKNGGHELGKDSSKRQILLEAEYRF